MIRAEPLLLVLAGPLAAASQTQVARWPNPDGAKGPDVRGPIAADAGVLAASGVLYDGGGRAFLYDTATGTPTLVLPDPAQDPDGLPWSFVPPSVDVDAGRVAVGARADDGVGSDAGRAYVYDAATGAELLELVAPDAAAGDGFGAGVGIAGAHLVVGAPGDDGAGTDRGSVYVFDAATGAFRFELGASNPMDGAELGYSVAVDGDVAIAGAPLFGAGNKGYAYLYDMTTGAELFALQPDVPVANVRFGWSVAIRGDRCAVGCPGSPFGNVDERVYVFDVTTGDQVHLLLPTGASPADFGEHVAIDDAQVLVGAWGERTVDWDEGAVYAYDLASGGLLARIVLAPNPPIAELGRGVALDGGRAFCRSSLQIAPASTPGTIHELDVAAGQVLGYFEVVDGADFDEFGGALALDAGLALVGAMRDDDAGIDAGAAFVIDVATGTVLQTLTPPVPEKAGYFGQAVAIEGGRALVGNPRADVAGTPDAGQVLAYDAATGALDLVLTQPVPAAGAAFGFSIAVDGGRALVGAPSAAGGGAAYLFDAGSGALLATFSPPAAGIAGLGWDVALDGPFAVLGAPSTSLVGPNVGAALVFDASTGAHLRTILPAVPAESVAWFGSAVALDGSRLVVGAPAPGGPGNDGSARVFDVSTGQELAVLSSPPDLFFEEDFGQAVAVQGTVAYVGEEQTWLSHAFDTETGQLLFSLSIWTPDPSTWTLGTSAAVDGDTVLVGAPDDGSLGPRSGAVTVFDVPATPTAIAYCAAKTSSAGCDAAIGGAGAGAVPVSGAADWSVTAAGVQGLRTGLLIGGLSGPIAAPFQGGTICLAPPWKRGPTLFSGGTAGACDGAFTQLVNDQPFPFGFDAGGGSTAWYQWWYRDPPNPTGPIALSDAFEVPFL